MQSNCRFVKFHFQVVHILCKGLICSLNLQSYLNSCRKTCYLYFITNNRFERTLIFFKNKIIT